MKNKKNNSGFTLIEALVLLFIFSLITITFYQVISVGTRYIIFSKNRLGAIALANEKMEIARNLKYDDVGIQNGACVGNIPQDEDISENGRNYHVHTLAAYIDDSFDGTLGDPNELAYKDYKMIKIVVSWNNGGADQGNVTLVSRFVPAGQETASVGDGILSINVMSNQPISQGISNAVVHIKNNEVGIDETRETDDDGNVMIVGAKESINRYEITVSKSGYETVKTYLPYPDTVFNPVDTHASVTGGEPNIKDIVQNKVSDLKVLIKNNLDEPVEGIEFNLAGGRILGTLPDQPGISVYNLSETEETGSNGEKEFDSISPGQYSFSLSPDETEYALISIDQPTSFYLAPESSLDLGVRVAPLNETAFLANIANSLDNSPISEAQVKLSGEDESYDKTITTGIDGRAFFSTQGDADFIDGTYNLEIKAEGFRDNTGLQVEIENGSLKNETYLMEIIE